MIKNLQKLAFFKSPWVIAAFVCFAIAFAIPFFAPKTTDVKGVSQKATPTPTATHSAGSGQAATPTHSASSTSNVANAGQAGATQWVASPTPLRQGSEGQAAAISTQAPQHATTTTAPTSAPQQVQSVETFQVHLSINGANVGDVTMQKDQNQCDVLTRAKDQGKISQLMMKYDNSLGTNGVYQINGVGKETAIWWVFKVNGQSPTQGCSYVKANSGDTVAWEYKG